MSGPRRVAVEVLDGLVPTDPSALRARRDLRRIHRVLGTCGIITGCLRALDEAAHRPVLRILELGAGDGSLMLRAARLVRPRCPRVAITLLDQADVLDDATRQGYAEVGWTLHTRTENVLDWAASVSTAALARATASDPAPWDLIVANLFLHHFTDPKLAAILAAVALQTEYFIACEPRRDAVAAVGSRLIGLLGVNAVTRTDAVLSVRAGFRATEIRNLWPAAVGRWVIQEEAAGLFSHVFCAVRAGADRGEAVTEGKPNSMPCARAPTTGEAVT